jgi:hypothetical protein
LQCSEGEQGQAKAAQNGERPVVGGKSEQDSPGGEKKQPGDQQKAKSSGSFAWQAASPIAAKMEAPS